MMKENNKPLSEIKIINTDVLDSTHINLEDCRCKCIDHFTPCGPMYATFAEVKLKDNRNNEVYYLTLAEIEGFPNYFLTDSSIYDYLVESDEEEYEEENDELTGFLHDAIINIEDYLELTEPKWKKKGDALLIAYYLACIEKKELKEFLKNNKGKLLKDVNIDKSVLDLDDEDD